MILSESVTTVFPGDAPPRLVNNGVVATYRWAGVPGASDVIETLVAATTFEWWEVDGVSLQTLAWNLRTWGGDKQGTPGLRGEDDLIPGRAGERWRPKQALPRTIVFEGWVIGAAPNGEPMDDQQFRKNWRMLRRLFWTPRRQVQITKRWVDDDGVLRAATGLGQCRMPIVPERTGVGRATFSVDVVMADPYFYGDEVQVPLSLGTNVVEIEGDDRTSKVWVEFQNAQTTAKVNVIDGSEIVHSLTYSSLTNGQTAIVDVDAGTVHQNGSPAFGKLTFQHRWLMPLDPGPNEIQYQRASGSGAALIRYRPAWV